MSKDPSKSGFMGKVDLDIGHNQTDSTSGKRKYAKPEKKEAAPKKRESKPSNKEPADPSLKLVKIPTDKVIPWDYANRPDSEFGDMDELITSIAESGQEVPVLVRPKGSHFELIYGRRRWRAAQHLGVDLLCRVKKIDDKEAFIAQANENENRKDLSAWARAKDFQRALDAKIFPTTAALASSIGMDRKSLYNLLAVNKIPQDIVDAIGDMTQVGIQAAKTIVALIGDEERGAECRAIIVENADKIASGQMGPKKIERLCYKVETKARASRVVSGVGGELFSISQSSRGALNITILKGGKKLLSEREISDALKAIFERKSGEIE